MYISPNIQIDFNITPFLTFNWRVQFIKISYCTSTNVIVMISFSIQIFVFPYLSLICVWVGSFDFSVVCMKQQKRRRGRRYLSSSTALTHFNRNDDSNDEHFLHQRLLKHIWSYVGGSFFCVKHISWAHPDILLLFGVEK